MEQTNRNPLLGYFRQPAIYFSPPSKGKFWPEGSIELPVTGELAIYPMTTRDEVTIKTPDALLNGSSVVDVIQSCIPGIKNAWDMPSIDVDAIMIALRIASYGPDMEIDATCTNYNCKEENVFSINLDNVLNELTVPDYSIPVNIAGVSILLRPQPYFKINKAGQVKFEEDKIMQTVQNDALTDEERNAAFTKHLTRIFELSHEAMLASTESVTINDSKTVVTDSAHISEWYQNVSQSVDKAVKQRLTEYAATMSIKPNDVMCPECKHKYKVAITFDYSSFFA